LLPAFGLDTIDQSVPSHTITNDSEPDSEPEPVIVEPTATHSDALRHDTELSESLLPAFGLDTIDQSVPSHTITNDSEPEPVHVEPTATHSDTLRHDTDKSVSSLVPAFGLDTIDHTMPSQTIVNVSTAEPVSVRPTATQSDALTHDTERI
jgi:hypothetical protein